MAYLLEVFGNYFRLKPHPHLRKKIYTILLRKLLIQWGKIASTDQSVGIAMTLWHKVRHPAVLRDGLAQYSIFRSSLLLIVRVNAISCLIGGWTVLPIFAIQHGYGISNIKQAPQKLRDEVLTNWLAVPFNILYSLFNIHYSKYARIISTGT